jgi:hypothetical protein
MDCNKFLSDIQDFINKSIQNDARKMNILTCNNIFKCDDNYQDEKDILSRIKAGNFETTQEQGNLLEELLKKLFNRISLISSLSVTNKDTALGQIDINLITVDEKTIYEVWGMVGDCPSCSIGECKNYQSNKVDRPEIEKTCWRACKGRALSFFIGPSYTTTAKDEIGEFNLHKQNIFDKSQGVYVVPITLNMLDVIISNNLNFCYFIRWAIQASKKMAIANYL